MKLKNIQKIIIFFISVVTIFSTITTAETSENSIVSVSSQKVNLNTDFYLILNLSNISFTKFKVQVTNTSSLKTNELTSTVSSLSNNAGITSFIVDKESINLEKLGLIYTSTAQESEIKFEVKITNLGKNADELQEEVDSLTDEITILNSNLKKLKDTLGSIEEDSEEYETISDKIIDVQETINSKESEKAQKESEIENYVDELEGEVSVEVTNTTSEQGNINNMEMQEDPSKSAWGDMDSMMMKDKLSQENEKMSSSMKEMMSKMSGLEADLENANNTITSLTSTNTYQGSQNNYLESLEIKGIEFDNEFKKTTTNYFAKVDKDTTSVTINAEAEDSNSIVTIYGNTDLQEGRNKVIISVTSESGSVRNYKIYITK